MTPEGQILKAVLDYLAARHVLAFRMNSGGLRDATGRTVRFGSPGMADVLAFPLAFDGKAHWGPKHLVEPLIPRPFWIEVKAAKGKQSKLQKSFQAQVEREGHRYILVRNIEDLEAALK